MVVAMNESPRLEMCLGALGRGTGDVPTEVVCVEVGPGSAPRAETRGGVRYLFPGINLGWAGAVHLARSHTDAPVLWLIQDDIVVEPDALAALYAHLAADPGLAAARALPVDASGLVAVGALGSVLDLAGFPTAPLPPRPAPPGELLDRPPSSYLPSSALMVRTEVWDEVGGFNPWFYPVGWIDVDFGLALAAAGRRVTQVFDAHVCHQGKGSTPSALGHFCSQRNHALLRALWFPNAPAPDAHDLVDGVIIEAARKARRSPTALSPADLVSIAGACAADSYLRFARWQSKGFDKVLHDYHATVEARDYWKVEFDKLKNAYDGAIAALGGGE